MCKTKRRRVLFIAPLPPPLSGHSIACDFLKRSLAGEFEFEVIDLSPNTNSDGRFSFARIFAVAKILLRVTCVRRQVDCVYFTISESVFGNAKDLIIYAILGGLRERTIIHLHGGTFRRAILDRSVFLRAVNRFYLSRLAGVIITGPSHRQIFDGVVPARKVYIIPNYSDEGVFVRQEDIRDKFAGSGVLRVLFMSSLTREKGYRVLVEGYNSLPDEVRAVLRVDLAGRVGSEQERLWLNEQLAVTTGITYHGLVNGEKRKSLYRAANILCLPSMHSEGQPLCILEAYAAGCVVISTLNGGIPDIFADGENGFGLKEQTTDAVAKALRKVVLNQATLLGIAMHNWSEACNRYRGCAFTRDIGSLLATMCHSTRL